MQSVPHDEQQHVYSNTLLPLSRHGLTAFLRKQPEKTLFLVAQDLTHGRVSEVAASAKQVACMYGYHLVPLDFHRSSLHERTLLTAIYEAHRGGVLFLWDYAHENLDFYAQIADQQPCIQVLDPKPLAGIDFVGIDEYRGGVLATRHLLNLGYRCIGHVTLEYLMNGLAERRRAYQDVLTQAGLPVRDEWQLTLPYGLSEADRMRRLALIQRFLAQPQRPDALFICADWVALEVIECAQEMGLSVPQDLALVGYDDAFPYSHARVPLTTIRGDAAHLGRLAVERLVQRLQGNVDSEAHTILLSPQLVVRESSAHITATSERWISATHYIHEHFRSDISAREVATSIGLDAHYFSQQFRQVFGLRFTEYLHNLRLQYAAQLLAGTNDTIEQIAHAAGFQSLNHFYTLFKRTYHLSPHAYRKQHPTQEKRLPFPHG